MTCGRQGAARSAGTHRLGSELPRIRDYLLTLSCKQAEKNLIHLFLQNLSRCGPASLQTYHIKKRGGEQGMRRGEERQEGVRWGEERRGEARRGDPCRPEQSPSSTPTHRPGSPSPSAPGVSPCAELGCKLCLPFPAGGACGEPVGGWGAAPGLRAAWAGKHSGEWTETGQGPEASAAVMCGCTRPARGEDLEEGGGGPGGQAGERDMLPLGLGTHRGLQVQRAPPSPPKGAGNWRLWRNTGAPTAHRGCPWLSPEGLWVPGLGCGGGMLTGVRQGRARPGQVLRPHSLRFSSFDTETEWRWGAQDREERGSAGTPGGDLSRRLSAEPPGPWVIFVLIKVLFTLISKHL